MKTKVASIAVVVAAIALLSFLGFYVKIGVAADSVAVLRTTGMTCGSCSGKIMEVLQRVKGVATAEVDVEGGWVLVGYDTKSVRPELLAEKINEAGYPTGVHRVLTPEQFRQITGRDIGKKTAASSGCCGSKSGGCNPGKQG